MDKKQICVLLLEDEAAHAEAIRRALESSAGDLKVHIVGSLKEFRDYIAANTPDIALLDMVLPDGNGIDLLRSTPESNAFPMLILTSHGNEKAAVDALKAGALDYVVKSPEVFADLPRILTRNLNQWTLIQQRKQAEEALKASEQNFHNSLEGSLIGIYIADKDWQPTFANRAFLNLFDYVNFDEVKMSPPHERYTPESVADLTRRIERNSHGLPSPNQIEVAITRKDGTIRHLHIFNKEIFWDGKKQNQLFYNDITQRIQAEEALKASEQNFHNSLDSSTMGIRITGDADYTMYANQALLDIFGYKNIEELRANQPQDYYTPESYASFVRRKEQYARGESPPDQVEFDIIRKDGALRHVQLFRKAVLWDGKPQFQILYNDITERVQAEAALKASEENLHNFLDNSSMGVRVRELEGNVLYFNQAFLDIFGYENIDEAKLKSPIEYYTPESYGDYLRRVEKIARGEKVPTKIEVDIVRKDGTLRHLLVIGRSVFKNGKQQGQTIYNDITERVQAEEALKVSEQNFRNSIDGSTMGIRICEKNGHTLYVNKTFLNIFGYESINEVGATPLQDHHTPEEKVRYLANEKKQLLGEPILYTPRTDIIRKDGTIRHLQVYRNEVYWNGKKNFQVTYNDITEHVQAEEALKVSEQNFRNSIDSSTMGIRIMGNVDYTVYANQALLDMFGYKNISELNASPPQEHYTPESHAGFVERHEKFLRGEPLPELLEFDIIRTDGAVRHLQLSSKNVLWDGKQQFQLIYIDITERKNAEKALRESEFRFRTLIENAPEAIILSRDGIILYANLKLRQLAGIQTTEEMIGRHAADLFATQSRQDSKERSRLRSMGIAAPDNFESIGLRADGSQFPIQVQVSQVQLSDGSANIAFVTDITQRKKAEVDLLEAQAQQKQIEQKAQITSRLASVGEMAAGIAHEINNPLTGVLGFSQMLLERENVPADIKESVAMIADGSQRVADIVKRLLTFARQAKPVKNLVNLNEIIENTLKLREYVLKTANIHVVTHYDPEIPLVVVDPGQMQQVFLNLIVNAEQAMKKAHGKGVLIITTKKIKNNIRISFQDDGPGITRENMEHLFEPFFTTKAIGEGTGLGLSLSRSIILEHDGSLSVESEFGYGAKFVIELPLIVSLTPPVEAIVARAQDQPSEKYNGKILVVDDEPGVRALLEKILTQNGYAVEVIADAGIARDKLDAGEIFDVILIDIRMPGMNGVEFYVYISEKKPALKNRIIIITGDVMGLDIKAFLAQNNLPSLSKPFDIKLLKKQIADVINAGHAENESTYGNMG